MIKWSHKNINERIQQAIQAPGMMGQPTTLLDRLKAAGQQMMGKQQPQIPRREM